MVVLSSFRCSALRSVVLALLARQVAGQDKLDTHRTKTPPMGWNSYNHYSCFSTEDIIKANAQAMVDLGLADAGYDYVVPDCGWTAKERTPEGRITWNTTFYPSGYPALIDHVHDLGLKFGVYSGAGTWQCHPEGPNYLIQASLGYEDIDAQTFGEWGGDYLKYDNCWADGQNFVEYYPTEKDPSVRFRTMAEALSKVSRPIVYGICQWGIGDNLAEWASKMGNNWRISNDIINNWISIWRITNQVVPFAKYSKPGNWNDMDMLMVGNGRLNYEESKTHFSLWCMGKSPLFIGAGLVDGLLSKEALSILTDKEMVAINQDALGEAAKLARRYSEEEYDVWVGNLSNSRTVLTVVNWSSQSKNIVVNLADAGIQAAGRAREVWEKRDLGPLNGKYSATIPGHGVKVLVLEDTNTAGTYTDGVYNLRRKTTSFKIIGITSSSRYSLKVVTGIAATRRRKVTIKATSNSLSSQITQYVTGSEYDIPNFILKAGVETTVQIHDPAAGSNKVSQLIVSLPNGVAAAYYPASSAVLSGNAKLLECSETPGACLPTGNKITNITSVTTSPTTAVTFKEVSSNTIAGPKMVYIDYINYDLAFDLAWNGLGTNTLNLTFSVNGGKGKYLQLPISGGDWEDTGRMGILLDGFVQDATPGVGKNEVKVWAPGWRFGADLVGIEVVG